MADPAAVIAQTESMPSPPAIMQPKVNINGYQQIPQLSHGMTFTEVGNSGLRAFAGYVREEFLPQLQGRQAQTVYREMSDNSPIIGAIIYAINATMRKVEWRTVPADDTPAAAEAAEFADSLRTDMSHTWEDSIAEGLSMITYGFAPQEIVYKKRLGRNPGPDTMRPGRKLPSSKYDDGKIGWRRLPIRGQDTVLKWFFDENGEIEGLTQQPYVGPLVDIPIQKLLLFRPTQHKNNPEGRSVLRNAYRSYFMTKRLEEQEVILYERMNGIPVIRVPTSLMQLATAGDPDATASMNTFKAMVVNLRIDEQMGLILPSDTYEGVNGPSTVPQYSLELIAPGGNGGRSSTQSDPTITRHQNNMLMSVLADFLSLGHGQTGTQALSVSKQDMFFQAVEGYLNGMAAVYNDHGLERVWELNGMDLDLMPNFEPDLAQNLDLDILGTFIHKLSQSGMALFPQQELESALLDAAGLPDIADPSIQELMVNADAMEKPQAVVGPAAAVTIAENAPPPPAPDKDSPVGKLERILKASIARRTMSSRGPIRHIKTT